MDEGTGERLSINQVAEKAGVSVKTVRRLVTKGQVPAERVELPNRGFRYAFAPEVVALVAHAVGDKVRAGGPASLPAGLVRQEEVDSLRAQVDSLRAERDNWRQTAQEAAAALARTQEQVSALIERALPAAAATAAPTKEPATPPAPEARRPWWKPWWVKP